MSSTNRAEKIKSLFKLLQKTIKHAPDVPERPVLEHLIYAACLENAHTEQADGALVVLEHHYIDWNEIRVSTANELAYTFPQLPDPQATGERVRRTLQAVFETTYMFDLEELKKKNLSHAIEYLESLGVCSRFMVDYTVQNALGGHVIPLDEPSLKVFRLLGLTQLNKTKTREEVSGLERAIPKNEGVKFASLLHEFAARLTADADSEHKELRNALKPLDAQALKRDCTPPELVVLKPEKWEKPKPKPFVPPMSAAAAPLDDEIDGTDDEHLGVQELEFIPNPITGEEFVAVNDELDEGDSEHSSPVGKKTKTKKTAPKKSDSPETSQQQRPAVPESAEDAPVSKEPRTKKTGRTTKTFADSRTNADLQADADSRKSDKTASRQTVVSSEKGKKSSPDAKQDVTASGKPPGKTDAAAAQESPKAGTPRKKASVSPDTSVKKSTTRDLRQKKPK